jgi:hypothetical protein
MRTRIESICAAEGVEMVEGTYEALATVSGGDMRKAITYIQSASRFYGKRITADAIMGCVWGFLFYFFNINFGFFCLIYIWILPRFQHSPMLTLFSYAHRDRRADP